MQSRRHVLFALACVATTAISSNAVADPDDIVSRPVVLARNQVAVDVTTEINLAPAQIGFPVSLAPDAWWGVSPRLTLGIVHSARSVDQIQPGASFCLRTGDNESLCEHTYQGSGLDVRWLAHDDGALAIALRARYLIRNVDPMKPAGTIGAYGRWHHGRFSISGDPYIQIGFANNDLGNRSRLVVPFYFALQPTRRWALALQTGYQSDFAVLGDGWHIPAALITTVSAPHGIDVSVEGGFQSALGPQNDVKQRVLFVTLGWRS